MKFHSYSEVFPLLSDSDLTELADDIKAFGLREPIWLYEGQILDGRNRFLACQKSKTKPTYRKFKGADEGALALVISANIKRRQLSDAQRAMAAARIATLRQGRPSENGSRDPFITQGDAADKMDVSPSSIKRAKRVIDKGSKALQGAVESGDVPLRRAASVVDLPKSEQLAAATSKPDPVKPFEITSPPTFDFSNYEPEDDKAYRANIENVMMADDKLVAMREELKQVHREMQGLKASRDHYQSQAGTAARLVEARDRQIAKLERQLDALRATGSHRNGLDERSVPA